jgi:membrane protease YdiL (CAAX protease family)
VWAASLLFFLAHLPNPVLLIAAAIAGPLLCELFPPYRNIYHFGCRTRAGRGES